MYSKNTKRSLIFIAQTTHNSKLPLTTQKLSCSPPKSQDYYKILWRSCTRLPTIRYRFPAPWRHPPLARSGLYQKSVLIKMLLTICKLTLIKCSNQVKFGGPKVPFSYTVKNQIHFEIFYKFVSRAIWFIPRICLDNGIWG